MVPLAALAGACVPAVIFALARHKRTVTDDAPDVVELAHELASLKKQVRRAYMQRVREGEGGSSLDQVAVQAPPELQTSQSPPTAAPDLKARLRAAVFSPGVTAGDWRKHGH
jgi:hypothetical protein